MWSHRSKPASAVTEGRCVCLLVCCAVPRVPVLCWLSVACGATRSLVLPTHVRQPQWACDRCALVISVFGVRAQACIGRAGATALSAQLLAPQVLPSVHSSPRLRRCRATAGSLVSLEGCSTAGTCACCLTRVRYSSLHGQFQMAVAALKSRYRTSEKQYMLRTTQVV